MRPRTAAPSRRLLAGARSRLRPVRGLPDPFFLSSYFSKSRIEFSKKVIVKVFVCCQLFRANRMA